MIFLSSKNPLIREARDYPNYKVVEGDKCSNICYVFFSSNGLYYPDTDEKLLLTLRNDRFEWENVYKDERIQSTGAKYVFVRDIEKSYYIEGISNECCSIEKLIELLKEITDGYEIVTVGSSAGAYIAMIVGCCLNAKKVISLSGIFSLDVWNDLNNDFFINHKDDKKYNKWFDVRDFFNKTPIFYFFPRFSTDDKKQYELVENYLNVYSFAFNERIHGKTMYSQNLAYIISSSPSELIRLNAQFRNKLILKDLFCIKTMGICTWINILVSKIKKERR